MCRRVQCSTCNRPTFAGCGAHIEQVLGDVPRDKRCVCREQRAASSAGAEPAGGAGSWLRNLFGK